MGARLRLCPCQHPIPTFGGWGTVPATALGPILVLEMLCATNHHLSLLDTAWRNPRDAARSHGPVFSPSPWAKPFCRGSTSLSTLQTFPRTGHFLLGSSPWKKSQPGAVKIQRQLPESPSPPAQLCSLGVRLQRPRLAATKSPNPAHGGGGQTPPALPSPSSGAAHPKAPNRGKAPWLGSACRRVQAGVGGRGINTRVTLLVPGRAARPLPTPGAGGSTHPRGARRGWGLAQGTPAQPGASPSPSFCAQRVGGAQGWWWWWGGGPAPQFCFSGMVRGWGPQHPKAVLVHPWEQGCTRGRGDAVAHPVCLAPPPQPPTTPGA